MPTYAIAPEMEDSIVLKARCFVFALKSGNDVWAMQLTAVNSGLHAGSRLVPIGTVPTSVAATEPTSPIYAAVAMGRTNLVRLMLTRDPSLANSVLDVGTSCGCVHKYGLQAQAILSLEPSMVGVLAAAGVSVHQNVYRCILCGTGTVWTENVLQRALSVCQPKIIQELANYGLLPGMLNDATYENVCALLALPAYGDDAIAVLEVLVAKRWSVEGMRVAYSRESMAEFRDYWGFRDFDEHMLIRAADAGGHRLCAFLVESLGLRPRPRWFERGIASQDKIAAKWRLEMKAKREDGELGLLALLLSRNLAYDFLHTVAINYQ